MMYLGYWTLAGTSSCFTPPTPRNRARCCRPLAAAAAGATVFMVAIAWLFSVINGQSLLAHFRNHAARINQGALSEGWSLRFAHFWHAEHGMLLWLAALGRKPA